MKFTISHKSDQEKAFINEVISNFKTLNTNDMDDDIKLDHVVKQIGHIIDHTWKDNAKKSRISKHSKQWWSDKCSQALNNYRNSREPSKVPKDPILMTKSRKSPVKKKALGNLPVGSTGDNFLRLRPSSTMTNRAYPQKVYGMRCIVPSTQLKIVKPTSRSSTISSINLQLNGLPSPKRNSNK